MATSCFPHVVAIEEYEQGEAGAIHAQRKLVGTQFPARGWEWAERAARAVGLIYCNHECEPPVLASTGPLESRILAARRYPRLCGVYHAGIIAAVDYDAVSSRAPAVTYKGLRNQACFEASRIVNARGRGVQVARKDCFTQACRALFPGESQVEGWVGAVFSASAASSDTEG